MHSKSFGLIVLIIIITNVKSSESNAVIERTVENDMTVKLPNIIAYYKLDFENNKQMIKYWKNRLQKVANNHLGIIFAICDLDQFKGELRDYGFEKHPQLREDNSPIVIAKDRNEVKYLLDKKLTVDSLEKFVIDLKNNKLIPYLRSDDIPDNRGKVVKEVVGKTFHDLVIANDKDVMILMYAHWCGHCEQFLPLWQQLGEVMKEEPNIDILQIDAAINEVPKPFEVISYPIVYWIPKNDKQWPRKYDGKQELNEFIIYISQYATNELIAFDRDGEHRN